jgi:hypothetical protein
VSVKLCRNHRTNPLLYWVVMTEFFYGAVEAGREFPCLAHLTPAEGVTVNLCARHHH